MVSNFMLTCYERVENRRHCLQFLHLQKHVQGRLLQMRLSCLYQRHVQPLPTYNTFAADDFEKI